MLLHEANGEIVENDVNMTESSTLSPENSLPETNSDLLTLKTTRPASPSSYIVTDDFIYDNKQLMGHINNMRQQLKYFEVQLQFNPDPEKTASIQAGLLTASQEIDATIAKLGVPLAKLPTTPEETSRIIKAVTETRNLPTMPRLQQQQHTRTLPQSQSNRSNVKSRQTHSWTILESDAQDGFIDL
ncbi:hypothetical protein CDAR_293131 [Caerostris darwini]|uniref:Uncharacterized protein n=1 Tax=Caerostris darwini TaxID=1538125 RepID=A0AAV4QG52_9ARAC|nr:hypothetical protein CDAR_293131 [Caerostris darwini]